MKLRAIKIANARSFLEPVELKIDGDISILIGPNGGGKTNVLDIIVSVLRRMLLLSWGVRRAPSPTYPNRVEYLGNNSAGSLVLDRHHRGKDLPQEIDLELEVTEQDIASMRRMAQRPTVSQDEHSGLPSVSFREGDLAEVKAGTRYRYRILNDGLHVPQLPGAQAFKEFLSAFEAENFFRSARGEEELSAPMLSMPVTRSGGGIQTSLALAGYDENSFKPGVDIASSRTGASPVIPLALGRLARKYRALLERDDGHARLRFASDPQMTSLTRALESLGYKCSLECTNLDNNQYDLRLTKEGTSFLASLASSGEKELLNYVFAIYGMNVRDALILVDEPELHLHPRWQRALLDLFKVLAAETGNQFVLATHSPAFVSPESVTFVSRVYSEGQESKIVGMAAPELPSAKHVFAIVNSQNNERIFFADKVVLVEGISDRILFEAIFRQLGVGSNNLRTVELVSVGGKTSFDAYRKLLSAFRVRHATIADLDYAHDIGDESIRGLFAVDPQKIEHTLITDPASVDGRSFVKRLGDAIETGDMSDLSKLWSYIKARRLKLDKALIDGASDVLAAFVESKRAESVFILKRGTIEDYLPAGHRSKDINKLVDFVSGDFWSKLPEAARSELELIARGAAKF